MSKINSFFLFFLVLFYTAFCIESTAQLIRLYPTNIPLDVFEHARILTPPNDQKGFRWAIDNQFNFKRIDPDKKFNETEWIAFEVSNYCRSTEKFRLSVAFSDHAELYIPAGQNIIRSSAGDLEPFSKRVVKVGQVCFLEFSLPEKGTYTCYLKISGSSSLSRQFRDFSIRSLKIYPEAAFKEAFDQPRIYQAFFYGAVLIMLCFNLFIYLSIRSRTYFYYLSYLTLLSVFLSSNSGYLLEIIYPQFPLMDLYVRFLSGPLLVIVYIYFSKDYLQGKNYSPTLSGIADAIAVLLMLTCAAEAVGFWRTGRSCFIILSIISFLLILAMAIISYKKGYGPARYFLAGNMLLIFGAIFYAFEHFQAASRNSFSDHALQYAILIEVTLFSMGLADRINIFRKELGQALVDKERREKEVEIERKRLIEEKNQELLKSNLQLDAFIYKTAHEVRGPLASLMGLCQIALLDVKDETSLNYLQKLNLSANRMNDILQRLNTAYEISNQQVKMESFALATLLEEVFRELEILENFSRTQIELYVDQPDHIHSDSLLVKFIFRNVIENAIKFAKRGNHPHQVKVNVKIYQDNITADILDNGVGINEEEASEIYSLFSKAAVKHQSPGLGLYMVKLSLEKLKGKISHGTENGMTKFSFTFPRS